MCITCNNIQLTVNGVYNYDPTRTTTLRNSFVADIKRRFTSISRLIKVSIMDNDCFGLTPLLSVNELTPAGYRQFAYPTNTQKAKGFMDWLMAQVEKGVLEVGELEQLGTSIDANWTNKYIFDSYNRGVTRARTEMRNVGISIPQGPVNIAMGTPIHIETLGVLYSRVFSQLKGITSAMDTQISIILTQGLADGESARVLTRKLISTINGKGMDKLGLTDSLGRFVPAQRRAETLARTEIVRAHHRANINEYTNWRVVGVRVKAEFMTAGDDRVCSRCSGLEGNRYTLEEATNLIPVHPNCRCICLPYEIKN